MLIERTENVLPGTELVDGKFYAIVHISDFCHPELDDAMLKWGNAIEKEVAIISYVDLLEVLDGAIRDYTIQRGQDKGAIEVDAKPLFDAMRKDLAEMIERIDALKFV